MSSSPRNLVARNIDRLGPGDRSLHTGFGSAPVLPICLIIIGGYLAWFAIHYWEGDVAWPTTPVKSLATGKGLPATTASSVDYVTTVNAIFNDGSSSSSAGSGSGSTAVGARTAGPALGSYNHTQLETLWTTSGGDPAKANKAAAVAQAESGGSPTVTSGNPDGGTNVGLWQLDTPGGKGAGHTIAQLQNPNTNAQVAIMGSSNGSDWSAWATAVGANPAYLTYMV